MYSGECTLYYNLPFVNQLKSDKTCSSLPIGASSTSIRASSGLTT